MINLKKISSILRSNVITVLNKNLIKMTSSSPTQGQVPNLDESEASSAKKLKLDNDQQPTIESPNGAEIANAALATPQDPISQTKLVNKRKYALVIGYCGEGYFGLQRYLQNVSVKFI